VKSEHAVDPTAKSVDDAAHLDRPPIIHAVAYKGRREQDADYEREECPPDDGC
jgi:hypothetical protein